MEPQFRRQLNFPGFVFGWSFTCMEFHAYKLEKTAYFCRMEALNQRALGVKFSIHAGGYQE